MRVRAGRAAVILAALAVLPALVAGCSDVNRLREAQAAFNEAAAAENAARLTGAGVDAAGTLSTLASARSGYAAALLSLEALEPDRNRLAADGLWGTALTLKALCHWRLGQFDPARVAAAEALRASPEQLYPRDRALIEAVPGLIMTDEAYAKILKAKALGAAEAKPAREALLNAALALLADGALPALARARALADERHPVQLYLVQAQLAAYRNLQVAWDMLSAGKTAASERYPREHAAARAQLADLNALASELESRETAARLTAYWARLCGVSPP
jgi:hypothetical protein